MGTLCPQSPQLLSASSCLHTVAKEAPLGQGSRCLFPGEVVQRALANAGSQASLRLCC